MTEPDRLAEEVQRLARMMRGRSTIVLSGAGMSTESSIPDYQGPQGSLRSRRPMQYREFVGSEDARRRYWARSARGWAVTSCGRGSIQLVAGPGLHLFDRAERRPGAQGLRKRSV